VKRRKYLASQSNFCFALKFVRIMGKHNKQGKLSKSNWTQLSIGNAMAANARVLRRLSQSAGTLVSSATGTYFYRALSSAAANAAEWASLAAVYVQYRTIEVRVTVVPLRAANPADFVLVLGTDRSGTLGVPTSYVTVWGLQAPKVHTSNMVKPAVYAARAIDLEDQEFTPVAAPVALYGVQFAVNSAAVSTTFAMLYLDWVVEFKGNTA
jgi:hypothetical protein